MADGGALHLSHSLMIIDHHLFVSFLLMILISFHPPQSYSIYLGVKFLLRCRFTPSHPPLLCHSLSLLSKWDASIHAFLTRAEGCACTSACMWATLVCKGEKLMRRAKELSRLSWMCYSGHTQGPLWTVILPCSSLNVNVNVCVWPQNRSRMTFAHRSLLYVRPSWPHHHEYARFLCVLAQ